MAQKWYKQNMIIESSIADTCVDMERLLKSERLLSRISYSFPKDWLPPYYIALVNIRLAEINSEEQNEINSNYFSRAYEQIAIADSLSKGNLEVKILKAYWAIAKNDSVLLEQLNTEMILLLPNPRAYFVATLYADYKKQIKIRNRYLIELIELCPNEYAEASFEPSWGCFAAKRLKQKWGV